ncbi:MAG: aldehyde dehydrogenase family protein [Candidatus Latescibacteria bacterium]|nr:aldehyde dehydrogenase family protein [Candidatus Latescibacterota bacterium]NIM22279.1 aldehyde dehydrogenase family protein [Candidatus Latescibacterota bacterium]NIM65758.1 aldehyde dehydrogenase family protein [Candidatus Latescibacterota bacterium]NIO02143.1 aldehyde dehydrogenase family protein [Candidatus Latescibacterota bacterium]NIO28975.1 aldehyde dehydrogenase family protein [Candidatus Latescibacterota bacterium]
MADAWRMYLGGEWVESGNTLSVTNPYDNSLTGVVHLAKAEHFTHAIDLAEKAFDETKRLPSYKRAQICSAISSGIDERKESFARMLTMEMGKTIREARGEVGRAVSTFAIAAEETKRIGGELMDLDWIPGHDRRLGIIRRFPLGVIGGIAPFNFPLNLVAHKVAPAIASGNTIVLKPASKTPIVALMLAELVDETDFPKGAFSVLPAPGGAASPLVEDERVKLLTFTGSGEVGWGLQHQSKGKRVALELGGNAGVIVADDADLGYAITRIVFGGFAQAGQSCISVQRIYIQSGVYEAFLEGFLPKVDALEMGDPLDERTDIGPMVDDEAVSKVLRWIDDAKAKGAKILTGGHADGRMFHPTVLADVDPSCDVSCSEVFAPLVVVAKYDKLGEAVEAVNDSRYGLQAGIFTNRFNDIWRVFEGVETGGVVVNDVPTYRADQMPYGGVKESGMGREGLRFAIEEMTEIKILAVNLGAGD